MTLPEGFVFSQSSLQDFVDCRRRFQLRVLRQQAWPALEVEPALEYESHSIRGQQLHSAIERYFLMRQYLSEPEARELIGASIGDDHVKAWWQAFLDEPPLNIPDELLLPEARLAIEVGGRRLVAVFDLLAVEREQRIVIVDWKTAHRRPARDTVAAALQTRVYPFVVVEGAADHFGGPVDPARVTMVYWYANYPDEPHVYHYSAAQYQADRQYLGEVLGAVDEALGDEGDLWSMTPDEQRCRYCVFRSFCGRGVEAGLLGSEVDMGVIVDLDMLDELEY